MFKKMNLSSPLGIALSVTAIVLALSPEARRKVRRLMVIGTAGIMDTMEHIGGIASGRADTQDERSKASEAQSNSDSKNNPVLEDTDTSGSEQ